MNRPGAAFLLGSAVTDSFGLCSIGVCYVRLAFAGMGLARLASPGLRLVGAGLRRLDCTGMRSALIGSAELGSAGNGWAGVD